MNRCIILNIYLTALDYNNIFKYFNFLFIPKKMSEMPSRKNQAQRTSLISKNFIVL